jgi:hypothetical protein
MAAANKKKKIGGGGGETGVFSLWSPAVVFFAAAK